MERRWVLPSADMPLRLNRSELCSDGRVNPRPRQLPKRGGYRTLALDAATPDTRHRLARHEGRP